MKSLVKVSLAALALAFAVSAYAAEKELIVATDTAFVPFEFKQGDKYVGFDIDLWDAIAKKLDLKYTLKPMDRQYQRHLTVYRDWRSRTDSSGSRDYCR